MDLIITRETYVCGEPRKVGDSVSVEEPHVGHLLASGCARRATIADKSPASFAPAIETAAAAPAPEIATTRPARRRG